VVGTSEIISDYPAKPVLAAAIKLIPESKISVENRRRVLMILGTTEIEGELRTFESGPIPPGGEGIVFIKPFEPVLGLIGDKFVLRLPTPQVTIGGGTILDLLESIPRKKELGRFKYLTTRRELTLRNFIESELDKRIYVTPESDLIWCDYSAKELFEILNDLQRDEAVEKFDDKYIRKSRLDEVISVCIGNLEDAFGKQPHLDGLSPEAAGAGIKVFGREMEFVFQYMIGHDLLIKKGNKYDLPNRRLTVRGEIKTAADRIVRRIEGGGFSPPTISELVEKEKINKEALSYLLSSGQAVKVSNTIVFHGQKWKEIIAIIKQMLSQGEELTVASLRGKLGNSRKYSLPILEETDRRQITVRKGDLRVKGARFEEE
jgi:selenocysteine-specific elongation factor